MNTRRWIYLAALITMLVLTRYFHGIRRPAQVGNAPGIEQLRDLPIAYTRHARCRMDCRDISEEEIRSALAEGRVNLKKSDPADKPCPTFALEDRTEDGQTVRIIFAACERSARVVTAIDLGREHKCSCD